MRTEDEIRELYREHEILSKDAMYRGEKFECDIFSTVSATLKWVLDPTFTLPRSPDLDRIEERVARLESKLNG